MEFRVLGPLEVRRDGHTVDIRGSKRRAVLALLVLHANEVVRTDRLIEDVWGEQRPANAAAALQNHISRLRKDLGADVLGTKPWGYVLRVQEDDIDLTRFERLLAEAQTLAAQERAALLADALALWRGPAFADLADEPALSIDIARLDDLRLAALEQRIDADLELGRHEGLIHELEALVAVHPLRERLRGQLILALYRSGRQAEALETYRETRRVLVEELGIEPSTELRELERAILRQDPALASTALPSEAAESETPSSRWRWPRSPLVAVGVLLLLAGAGAAGAVVALRGGPSPVRTTLAQDPEQAVVMTRVITRSAAVRHTPARPKRQHQGGLRATVRRAAAPARQPHRASDRPVAHTQRATRSPKTRTTRTAPARQPTSTQPFVLGDSFDTAAFDSRLWHRAFNGTGGDLAQRNARLEIGLAADAVLEGPYHLVEAHYGTNCRLAGDFDVHVEFQLLTWPQQSGAALTLAAWRSTAGSVSFSRFAYQSGEGYALNLPLPPVVGPGSNAIRRPSMDDVGALRLRRREDFLTAYYRRAGSWEAIGGAPYLGNVLVALQLSAGPEFSQQPVRVAFDNFAGEAEDVDCPNGVEPPPRKHRP